MPLDVRVPVRLESGEALGADCVRAEARNGDSRLPAGLLRVQVLGGPQGATSVRVFSSTIIDEPVATLQLTVGCDFTVSREYVLFAEPLPAVAQPPALPVVDAAPAAATVPASVPEPAPAAAAARPAAGRPTPAPSAVRPTAPRATTRAQALPRAATEARPRLRLEPTEPVREAPTAAAMREAFDAVARAASAAEAAASAASSAQARVVELESTLSRMTQEAKARDVELARLRQALAEGARPSLDAGLLWSGLVSMLVALSLWLGWRLRALRRQQEAAWAEAAAQVPAPVPASVPGASEASAFVPTENTAPDALRTAPSSLSDFSVPAPVKPQPEPSPEVQGLDLLLQAGDAHDAEGPQERTEVLPQVEPDEVWPVREVSIEELIDLDQQAEFFLALGQDSAAVDLLVAHLRDTGGGSPLTYLKLLEIYARQGDQAAYERLRERFNQRYHAQAPEWGQDLMKGRSLEDYPEVVPRLLQAWARPLGAMAELEELLMRSSRSAPLDLPAYRDVLFLYSLARDRVEQGAPSEPPPAETGEIDLLLPLDEPAGPMLDLEPLGGPEIPPRDAMPTSPVDLDLSLPELDLDLTPSEPEAVKGWQRPAGAKDESRR